MKYLLIVLLIISNVHSADTKKTDATTGATPAIVKKEALPPKSDTYSVLGWIHGNNGYLIKYSQELFRGGDVVLQTAIDTLKQFGVKTIVSISPTDSERTLLKTNSVQLIEIPFNKDSLTNKEISDFLDVMKQAKSPIYVHCHSGLHRAGIFCLSYRIYNQKWPVEKALIEFGKLGGSLKDDNAMIEKVLTFKPRI